MRYIEQRKDIFLRNEKTMFYYGSEDFSVVPYFAEEMTDAEIEAARRGMMGICRAKDELFNVGDVEIVSRYADCTMFKCPCCKRTHDDRVKMGSSDLNVRNGYTVVDPGFINLMFPVID